MKSILQLFCAILIASSSAFFILGENAEVVEAVVCPPGEFPHLQRDGTIQCKNAVETDTSDEALNEIEGYILTFLKTVTIVTSAFVALIVTYAGYLYIISEGSPMKTEQAKQMLFRAGIGILFLSLSFFVMNVLSIAIGISW